MLYIKASLCLKQAKHIFDSVIFQLISFLCCKKTQEKAPVIFWGYNFALVLHGFQIVTLIRKKKERK